MYTHSSHYAVILLFYLLNQEFACTYLQVHEYVGPYQAKEIRVVAHRVQYNQTKNTKTRMRIYLSVVCFSLCIKT